MGKLVWIASFPKSGNTWLRMLLANYLANSPKPIPLSDINKFTFGDNRAEYFEAVARGRKFADLSDRDLLRLTPAVHARMAAQTPNRALLKTHNLNQKIHGVPLITPEVTAGAIYLVRNPLDVVASYSDHLGEGIDYTIAEMANPKARTYRIPGYAGDYRGGWSDHVRSWCETSVFPVLVVRYETLMAEPEESLAKICKFLQLPITADRIRRAVDHSRFDVLAADERASGFSERSPHSKAFFREGAVGKGKALLSQAQESRLYTDHGPVMRALGYPTGP